MSRQSMTSEIDHDETHLSTGAATAAKQHVAQPLELPAAGGELAWRAARVGGRWITLETGRRNMERSMAKELTFR